MSIIDEIISERNCGVVHIGVVTLADPTIASLAAHFRLKSELPLYHEIDKPTAEQLAAQILHKDLAYEYEIMPEPRASNLARRFIEQFDGVSTRYYTNGTFYKAKIRTSAKSAVGASWNPVTKATFDTGILIINPTQQGCLWVEDED